MTINIKLNIEHGDFTLRVEHKIPVQGVTAIFGASGSGKTSLLRAIAGLDKFVNGSVVFCDQIWQSETTFLATHLRKLAYVFQEPSLFSHLDVRGNLEFAVKRTPKSEQIISLEQAVQILGLGYLLDRDTTSLSGGEKQRVAIARALCSSPRLLLMDEPLAALDRQSKDEILPYLDNLHRNLNIPILYVSHSLDEVARLADHLMVLEQGRIVAAGEVNSMLTQLDLGLALDGNAESVVDATVAEHDDKFDLTYLDSQIGRFSVPHMAVNVGDSVRVLIAARDVSITLQAQQNTSILNIFPGRIDEVYIDQSAQATVRVMANGVPVLAKITRKSVEHLRLNVGDSVYLQAKSVALL